MTTIAYAYGVLASDGRLTEKAAVLTDNCKKVFKLPDGSLFGASGDHSAGEIILKAVRAGIHWEPLYDACDVHAIHIKPNGTILTSDGGVWMEWYEPFIAIGSGKRNATTALRLGFGAIVAVGEGIAGDVYSGGEIQFVKLKGIT